MTKFLVILLHFMTLRNAQNYVKKTWKHLKFGQISLENLKNRHKNLLDTLYPCIKSVVYKRNELSIVKIRKKNALA